MSRRDSLPPCPRCGGTRGAHAFGCIAPAVDRTSATIGKLTVVSREVITEALKTTPLDTLVKLSVLFNAEIAARPGAARSIGGE